MSEARAKAFEFSFAGANFEFSFEEVEVVGTEVRNSQKEERELRTVRSEQVIPGQIRSRSDSLGTFIYQDAPTSAPTFSSTWDSRNIEIREDIVWLRSAAGVEFNLSRKSEKSQAPFLNADWFRAGHRVVLYYLHQDNGARVSLIVNKTTQRSHALSDSLPAKALNRILLNGGDPGELGKTLAGKHGELAALGHQNMPSLHVKYILLLACLPMVFVGGMLSIVSVGMGVWGAYGVWKNSLEKKEARALIAKRSKVESEIESLSHKKKEASDHLSREIERYWTTLNENVAAHSKSLG